MVKSAASLSIGDRNLPLEADLSTDIDRDDPLVGRVVEVTPVAGGELLPKIEEPATITGVFRRQGRVVGYEVKIGGTTHFGSLKDIFIDRNVLEDIQPPTATSVAIEEALSQWRNQKDYWHTRTDGLESLCFELASATPQAQIRCFDWGWEFRIPEPMYGQHTVVDCRSILHGNFWTLRTSVYPVREPIEPRDPPRIPDHWARAFSWAHQVATGMVKHGYPWEKDIKSMEIRAKATAKVLRPLLTKTLKQCWETREALLGKEDPESGYVRNEVTAAFSTVRLKTRTVGLTEPPTDRRVYTVVSIAPKVAKDLNYLKQVVLHECIHITVASKGGEPHNDDFHKLAEKLGLERKHRD